MSTVEEQLPEDLTRLEITDDNNQKIQNISCNCLTPDSLKNMARTIEKKILTRRNHNPFDFESPEGRISANLNSSNGCENLQMLRSTKNNVSEQMEPRITNSVSINGVVKTTPMKKVSPSRKLVLRPPVLKALKTYIHSHQQPQSLEGPLISTLEASGATSAARVSETRFSKRERRHGGGISDFRELIDECNQLFDQDLKVSDERYRQHQQQQLQIQQQNCYIEKGKFRRKNSIDIVGEGMERRNAMSCSQQEAGYRLASSTMMGGMTSECDANKNTVDVGIDTGYGYNVLPDSACDDVNIDELASYFDTFVYIPKKMSTMAEMMYI